MQEQQADGAGGKEYQDKHNYKNSNDLECAGTPLGSSKLIKKVSSTFFHIGVGQARK